MRILFTFVGGTGHFNPLLPIARAARSAGHEVAFAGRRRLMAAVEAAGFIGFPTGTAVIGEAPTRAELRAPDAAHEARVVRRAFAGRFARERAPAILALGRDWRPDLLVCDEMDFGAMIAAERMGIPHASVLVIAAGGFARPELIAEPLQLVRTKHGLPSDPELTMLSRYLVLAPIPPSFRHPADPLPATAHLLRPMLEESGDEAVAPYWLTRLDDGQLVYFTLGTVFNVESGDLLERVTAALSELPITLVVTVGREIDPAALGPQPANVHIERYIPPSALLPSCRVVVSHGGSGSVLGALAHGLPMVLIPLGADQLNNGERCAALGVGRVLEVMTITADGVREAVRDVLSNPAYRQRAERIKAEAASLPGPEHATALLERLAAEQRPLVAERAHRDPKGSLGLEHPGR